MEYFGVRLKPHRPAVIVKEWQKVQRIAKVNEFKSEFEAQKFIGYINPILRDHVEIYNFTRGSNDNH